MDAGQRWEDTTNVQVFLLDKLCDDLVGYTTELWLL